MKPIIFSGQGWRTAVSLQWIHRNYPPRKCGVQIRWQSKQWIYAAGVAWSFPTLRHVEAGELFQEWRLGPFIVGRKRAG